MNRCLIAGARVVTPDRILSHGTVLVEDGLIAGLSPDPPPPDFDGAVIEGGSQTLVPGFIDLHCHGGGGHDFMDATPEAFTGAAGTHARHGTTTLYPTTLAGGEEELFRVFDAYHAARQRPYNGASMPGLHLEGPFFSPLYKGAQDERYLRHPDLDFCGRVLERAGGAVARWSAAPELPGGMALGRYLRGRGVLAAAGHTAATAAEMTEAYENGYTVATHLYSGMSSVTRRNGFRTAGAVEAAFLLDGMTAELIADGCHLPPELLRLAYKIKGAQGLALVTDAMRAAGMPEGSSVLGSRENGQPVIVENGVALMPDRQAFAGSVCTADRLLRTMTDEAGVPLSEALAMLTTTPARVMGLLGHKGRIAAGHDADLVLLDRRMAVALTMVGGRIVYDAGTQ